MDFYSVLSAFAEGVDKFLGDGSLDKCVGFKGDIFFCSAHGIEHGWVESISIDESCDVVAFDPR